MGATSPLALVDFRQLLPPLGQIAFRTRLVSESDLRDFAGTYHSYIFGPLQALLRKEKRSIYVVPFEAPFYDPGVLNKTWETNRYAAGVIGPMRGFIQLTRVVGATAIRLALVRGFESGFVPTYRATKASILGMGAMSDLKKGRAYVNRLRGSGR